MDPEALLRGAAAFAPVLVALLAAARAPGARRARLRHDAEILEKLPPSRAHELLLASITAQLEAEQPGPNAPRRNTTSLAGALLTAPLFGLLAAWLIEQGRWWTVVLAVPVALLVLVLVYGIFESAQRVPRDAKGQRLQR